MITKKITLNQVQLKATINNTAFLYAYKKLATGDTKNLTENEKFLLLKFAVIFLNYGEKELEKFGYRIILSYSNLFDDYVPLYDVAMNKDYIPVAKFIEDNYLNSEEFEQSFHKLLMSSYKDGFKHIRNEKEIYFSAGQKRLHEFSKNTDNFIIVAPTSYGKSELIIHKIEDNLDKNICVIVPTKSLLAQTRKNLIKNSNIRISKNKIITHPDMLNDISKNFIAVLTQERLLRLLQKHTDLTFDIVLIDEAHNLIENDSRDILTIQDLKILKKRNVNIKFYYFTPFLISPENLKIFPNEELLVDKIHEFIKVEKYFVFDLTSSEKILKIYDQFINDFINIKSMIEIDNSFEFINKYAANKNIIYINRPKHIEEFSASIQNPIEINQEIQKVQESLKEFLHKDYNLIKTIKNGVVYHHGGMPENVRLYVESSFSKIKEIKYIVTTSTLLQGVNIPAEKIFLLDTKKGRGNLNAAQFKNLSGRVCRFSEVFDKNLGDLTLLEPEIYIIKSLFSNSRANIEKFLQERVKDNKIILDEISNPLIKQNLLELNEDEKRIVKEAEEYQENIEEGSSSLDAPRIVNSVVAKACFKNNIHDFDIFKNEESLESNYQNSKDIKPVSNSDNLILLIAKIFLWKIKLKETHADNFSRLENDKAKMFYSMLLEWRSSGTSYNEMINKFIWYWDQKDDPYIYVGTKWGEITSPYKEGFGELYIDLSKKTLNQKVNIAILRIKEEQDFVDYKLMPYVEILNDLKLIESKFYDKIKYGTSDLDIIKMLKEGFSIELAKIVKSNYLEYINLLDSLIVNDDIINKMKENNENEILIFEIGYYIN
ncbi:Helicase conserved C-terminal domain protein [uncultured Gammaproteobacteria bacterium]|nr:Helicase conserved C-terminal domain protein [uncultured Gammaproteobacteria bacterium]CAC9964889.1 Helicase conserved C-terminal domain protein [uncultured Gammaproteobacteria bacterium]